MKKSENKKSFEENIARLEEIVALLEKGDAPLSDSLSLFQVGSGVVAVCNTMLSVAELLVVKIQKGP